MIRFECTRTAQLLQARASGLSQASALRLEDHLAHCADCSHQAHLLDGLRELSDASAEPLAPGARQRAVLQAFARVERPDLLAPAKVAWLVPSACGALLAAALVAVGVARQPLLDVAAEARVLSGALEHTTRDDETVLASRTGGVMALAHAKVELRAETRTRWHARERVLFLDRGSVVAEVDPAKHQSFGVDTGAFRVLVLGTRFEVTKVGVRVLRGRVRVEAPNGTELAMLRAGESYACAKAPCRPMTRLAPAAAAANPPATSAQLVAGPHSSGAERSRRDATVARVAGEGSPDVRSGSPSPTVERQLERARDALGRREVAGAREILAHVLRERLARRDRAEALTLRAECSLVAGDLAGASAGYARVAKSFADLPAGENALFASARLDSERLSGASAQAGLARYLARYPRGKFVKEATARLNELRTVRPQP